MLWVTMGCARVAPSLVDTVEYQTVRGAAFGTGWSVTWAVVEDVTSDQVVSSTEASLHAVDVAMSTWRDDSELSHARRTGKAVPVSEPTGEVVRAALVLAEATGGAFDPTVQPLMELWGFYGPAACAVA
jgi:thiamine biosynthesis lipoprotein